MLRAFVSSLSDVDRKWRASHDRVRFGAVPAELRKALGPAWSTWKNEWHTYRSYRKSDILALWSAYPRQCAATVARPFRHPDDLVLPVAYPAFLTASGRPLVSLVGNGSEMPHKSYSCGEAPLAELESLVAAGTLRTVTLQDASDAWVAAYAKRGGCDHAKRSSWFRGFAAAFFPQRSKYEMSAFPGREVEEDGPPVGGGEPMTARRLHEAQSAALSPPLSPALSPGLIARPRPCSLLYIELGANNGDGLRAVLHGMPSANVAVPLVLATQGEWRLNETCVHGFEPNADWGPRLRALHAEASAVAEFKLHLEAAVVDDHPTASFTRRERCKVCVAGVSNTLLKTEQERGAAADTVSTVRARNFPRWLEAAVEAPHRRDAAVVVRCDVEGFEYILLPVLAASGVGRRLRAQNRRLFALVEWHPKSAAAARVQLSRPDAPKLPKLIKTLAMQCASANVPWTSAACNQMMSEAGMLLFKESPVSRSLASRPSLQFDCCLALVRVLATVAAAIHWCHPGRVLLARASASALILLYCSSVRSMPPLSRATRVMQPASSSPTGPLRAYSPAKLR